MCVSLCVVWCAGVSLCVVSCVSVPVRVVVTVCIFSSACSDVCDGDEDDVCTPTECTDEGETTRCVCISEGETGVCVLVCALVSNSSLTFGLEELCVLLEWLDCEGAKGIFTLWSASVGCGGVVCVLVTQLVCLS